MSPTSHTAREHAAPVSGALGLRPQDSTLTPPIDPRPPAGAPNVVVIVLDDTGFAHLGSFGSDIATPQMDALASGGLRYNRYHVTSLCTPTRAAFFTGRNHHAVGMGFLADIPMSFPGYTARIPPSAAALPRLLRDAGYATVAIGKWHLTPRWQRSSAGPFTTWPLGLGFERYYGFLQGDTNQWTPNLVCDNHYVEPPRRPEEGYHLTEDLVDRAIGAIADVQHGAPGKPFFLYFAPGAMHAPHQVTEEWVRPYHGRFDAGWDDWRATTFARQVELGIVPEGTVLTERPPWVQGWDELDADERRMHARQQEVFAGFLTHTDAQIGRLLDHLRTSGLLDDTLVLLFSDNGASAEGGRLGSPNEHRFTARLEDSVEENLSLLDQWGGHRTYNHYSWAWAWAGNTPLRLWKRYTWLGGVRTPLIVHWPSGMGARGEVRSQFAHAIDLMPTVLDAIGIEPPAVVDGVTQLPVDGASLRPTFDAADAPDPRPTQYFEMMASRALYHRGYKVTTDFVSEGVIDEERLMTGSRELEGDHWALFDLSTDFSESTDVSETQPDRVREMKELWFSEAGRNQVLPLSGTFMSRMGAMVPPAYHPGNDRTFVPLGGPVVDESVPMLFGGFRITADVDVPAEGAEGVLCAMGDWHGGLALFVSEGRLTFVFSRAGELLELTADEDLPRGPASLGVWYALDARHDGRFVLLHGERPVGTLPVGGMLPVAIQHGGAALRLGHDAGFPVSERYRPPATFTGILHSVRVETPGTPPADGSGDAPRTGDAVRAALHAD
jgi:arylsulfatase